MTTANATIDDLFIRAEIATAAMDSAMDNSEVDRIISDLRRRIQQKKNHDQRMARMRERNLQRIQNQVREATNINFVHNRTRIIMDPDDIRECCICMDCTADVLTPCNHQFCTQCISSIKSNDALGNSKFSCPLCRTTVTKVDCMRIEPYY